MCASCKESEKLWESKDVWEALKSASAGWLLEGGYEGFRIIFTSLRRLFISYILWRNISFDVLVYFMAENHFNCNGTFQVHKLINLEEISPHLCYKKQVEQSLLGVIHFFLSFSQEYKHSFSSLLSTAQSMFWKMWAQWCVFAKNCHLLYFEICAWLFDPLNPNICFIHLWKW